MDERVEACGLMQDVVDAVMTQLDSTAGIHFTALCVSVSVRRDVSLSHILVSTVTYPLFPCALCERETDRKRERERETERQTDKETDRQTERQTDRQ